MVCRLSLPEGTGGMDQSRGLGLFHTTLSVLVLQKSLSIPELGAGMGRGLCLAGQWVLIPHASTSLREVPHFLTSPRPALGGPGQTPGLGTGAHRRGGPVGCNKPGWTRLIPPGWERPSCRREGKKWRKFPNCFQGEKLLWREKCFKGQNTPWPVPAWAGDTRPRLWGGAGQEGCGSASPGKPEA